MCPSVLHDRIASAVMERGQQRQGTERLRAFAGASVVLPVPNRAVSEPKQVAMRAGSFHKLFGEYHLGGA